MRRHETTLQARAASRDRGSSTHWTTHSGKQQVASRFVGFTITANARSTLMVHVAWIMSTAMRVVHMGTLPDSALA